MEKNIILSFAEPRKLSGSELDAFDEMPEVTGLGTSGYVDKDFKMVLKEPLSYQEAVPGSKNKLNVVENIHWGDSKKYIWKDFHFYNGTCFDRPISETEEKPRYFSCYFMSDDKLVTLGFKKVGRNYDPKDPFGANRETAIKDMWLADINKDGLFDIVVENDTDFYVFINEAKEAPPPAQDSKTRPEELKGVKPAGTCIKNCSRHPWE